MRKFIYASSLLASVSVSTHSAQVPLLPSVVGLASWYGPGFDGRLTAKGEIFRMHEISAAHRTLPLGTKILVRNIKNGKKIIVRVNDRGPYITGRVLDLSLGAAEKLEMSHEGLAQVEIQVMPQVRDNRLQVIQ